MTTAVDLIEFYNRYLRQTIIPLLIVNGVGLSIGLIIWLVKLSQRIKRFKKTFNKGRDRK